MKIERLLGIVVYLLNREIVNANTLAEKFDIDDLPKEISPPDRKAIRAFVDFIKGTKY